MQDSEQLIDSYNRRLVARDVVLAARLHGVLPRLLLAQRREARGAELLDRLGHSMERRRALVDEAQERCRERTHEYKCIQKRSQQAPHRRTGDGLRRGLGERELGHGDERVEKEEVEVVEGFGGNCKVIAHTHHARSRNRARKPAGCCVMARVNTIFLINRGLSNLCNSHTAF